MGEGNKTNPLGQILKDACSSILFYDSGQTIRKVITYHIIANADKYLPPSARMLNFI